MAIRYHPYDIPGVRSTPKSLGFYGTKPIAQQAAITDVTASDAAVKTAVEQLADRLTSFGLTA